MNKISTKKNIKQNLDYYLTNEIEFERITKNLFLKSSNILKRKDMMLIYDNLMNNYDIPNNNLLNSKNLESLLEINDNNKEEIMEFIDFQFYIKSIFEILSIII